jgi:hypothetical protein
MLAAYLFSTELQNNFRKKFPIMPFALPGEEYFLWRGGQGAAAPWPSPHGKIIILFAEQRA